METIYESVAISSVDSIEGDTLKIKGYANRYSVDGSPVIDDFQTTFKPTSFQIDNYKKNPVLLFNHDMSMPVGRVTLLEIRSDGLYIEAIVYKESDPTTYHNIRNKVITSFSIGAYATEQYWSDLLDADVITKAELVEISVVPLPSNIESTVEEVSLCSLGVCSVVRSTGKRPTNNETSVVDKALIKQMVKKLTGK